MNVLKVLSVLILSLKPALCFRNDIRVQILTMVDVIRSYERPSAILANVCYDISDIKILAKELMQVNGAKTFQLVENFSSIEKFKGDGMVILLDLDCLNSGKILEDASQNGKFQNPYRWLLFSSELEWEAIMKSFENLSILIDSDVTVAYNMKSNGTILQKVYRIDSNSKIIPEKFATWSVEDGLSIETEAKRPILMRRTNLQGKKIGISLVTIDNTTTKTDIFILKDLVKDNLAKSSFHNVLPLYAFLNASSEIMFSNTWGYYINNTWNGMIGQISRGEADLCGTVTFMSERRSTVISYLTQPIKIQAKFIFREPPLSLQNNLFYLPFRTTVWISCGALMVLIFVVIYVNAKWEAMKLKVDNNDPSILKPDVSDVAILVVGAVVQQSSYSVLQGSRGRLVIFLLFLICLFLYTAYSANIVALLQSSSDQIRTLSDLLESKLELGVEDQPYTRHYFTTATEPVRKAIYESKVARTGYKPNFMPVEEGVKKLQNLDAPFAFHMNTGLGYRLIEENFLDHEKCGLREIQYVQSGVPWLCCRKQSPFKELYKIGLARILEHGISDRVNRLIYTRKPSCNSRSGSFGSVNMTDFHPVLLCLLYGIITSLLLLVIEILVYKRNNENKMQQKNDVDDRASEASLH
uniref:Ionotropic receptor n=1 Tax=Semiothisa cinerearia TaxID=2249628 RepID=A0A889XLC7_9NEOP|nr:ionotropic receptor [Semiothisa cinerearia]